MFRSQSKSKSLKLQRETVRVLDASHLGAAQGGGVAVLTNAPAICNIEIPVEISGGGAGPISNGLEGCPRLPTVSVIVNPRPILHP